MGTRGGRLGHSRLVSYTYIERKCRICDKEVEKEKLNLHFRSSHPDIYYNEYPARKSKLLMVEEELR